MNDGYVRIWKETVVAYFEVPENAQEKLVTQLKLEPFISTALLHQCTQIRTAVVMKTILLVHHPCLQRADITL